VDCLRVQILLSEYVGGELPSAPQEAVARHLASCSRCHGEMAAYGAAFEALGAPAAPSPDLWTAFHSRLAAETSCAAVRAVLPQWAGDAASCALEPGVTAHLSGCGDCRSEQQRYARAMDALSQAAVSESPDLWPALARRLSERRQWCAPTLAWRLPALGPVAAGATAALVLVAALHLFAPEGGSIANVPSSRAFAPVVIPPVVVAPAVEDVPDAPGVALDQFAANELPARDPALAVGLRPPASAERPRSRSTGNAAPKPAAVPAEVFVSLVPDLLGDEIPPDQLIEIESEREVVEQRLAYARLVSEIVHAVEMLAGVDDVAAVPFGPAELDD
jgi:predicted anti-sigma-YlaC factor YlaD